MKQALQAVDAYGEVSDQLKELLEFQLRDIQKRAP